MSNVVKMVMELEEVVRQDLRLNGLEFLVESYQVPDAKSLTSEEVVQYCVKVEYENAFK
jgi:hypothetical protein